ncbi:serine hydrolase domain-containing protein [Flagellimonas allohymeniacidonis]|uniref:Class A beta-lactamase-related serine hydrolase n=1 Tax=Flagellimonas allohymeniacidonis TaxID=2517819 RepID=A0A4Q8QBQ6_9FLAO|nr:serine hydrolase domain-containing protein [Allomuricauda hymeniacidonis]TAI46837.1 class A beta-lactamase-related serine hydrolase [Allomuricauda hymeniacidonis]
MKKTFLFIFFCGTLSALAQLSPIEEQEIDSIFQSWKDKDAPGVASGLIYGKTIKYTKAFGLADVENKKPITPQTKFQVDYLSRQFTALAILLLEEQGKIAWNDPIQKYLPDFPEYEHPLAVSHLLNHSSGLNDYEMLKGLLGKQENDVFTHEDALLLIKSQRKLNFVPGTQFSFMTSKTELTLLAEIIKKASGQSFSEFTGTNIFGPLQMNHTMFVEDYNTIIPNVAKSYQIAEEELFFRKTNIGNAGPTNLYTSAQDLLKWYDTLTGNSQSELASLIKRLDEPVKLDDGSVFESWWGRLTLGRAFYHKERGLPAFWQFGLAGGYAANVFRFPEQELTSFVIGNNNTYNGMPAMLQANHFIENEYTEPSSIDPTQIDSKNVPPKQLKKFEGHYWDAKRGIARKLHIVEDTLFYARLEADRGAPMLPLTGEDRFQLQIEGDEKIIFSFKTIDENLAYEITLGDSRPYTYVQYQPVEYTPQELEGYTGRFLMQDLNLVYHFKVEKGQLIALGPEGSELTFHSVSNDVFRSPTPSMGSIRFQRNQSGAIIGFAIYTDGIQNMQFKKLSL